MESSPLRKDKDSPRDGIQLKLFDFITYLPTFWWNENCDSITQVLEVIFTMLGPWIVV